MEMRNVTTLSSAIGTVIVSATDKGVNRVEILGPTKSKTQIESRVGEMSRETEAATAQSTQHLQAALVALSNYFDGGTHLESVPLDIAGTPFQMAVWNEIEKLGPGAVATYGEIAERIGNPKAMRAVGAAVGANPIPLFIGCHRVLGSQGRITGYSGGDGLPTKRLLLTHEAIGFKE